MNRIKKIIIMVGICIGLNTFIFSMQKCPSLTHLSLMQVINNILVGKSDKQAVINVMPFKIKQPFLELLAMAEEKYDQSVINEKIKDIFGNASPATNSLLSWIACSFILQPAANSVDLLIRSAFEGNTEIITYLIEKAHVDVNSSGKLILTAGKLPWTQQENVTPLMAAALSLNLASTTLLLEHKANPRKRNNNGDTALTLALRSLFSGADDRHGYKAFANTLSSLVSNKIGDSDTFVLYQEKIEDLYENNSIDKNFSTILLNRLKETKIPEKTTEGLLVIELLLLHKAFPNMHTISGETPLTIAIRKNNIEAVQLLLKYGAKPDYAEGENKSPVEENLGTPVVQPKKQTPLEVAQEVADNIAEYPDIYTQDEIEANQRIIQLLNNALAEKNKARESRLKKRPQPVRELPPFPLSNEPIEEQTPEKAEFALAEPLPIKLLHATTHDTTKEMLQAIETKEEIKQKVALEKEQELLILDDKQPSYSFRICSWFKKKFSWFKSLCI